MRAIGPFLLIGICLTVAPAPATAQSLEPGDSRIVQLTWSEAIEHALARNRDLAVARREIDVSRGRFDQARRYPFNPELALEGDVGRATGRDGETGRREIGGGSVGVAQVVEVRGQRGIRIRGAQADLARAEWATRDTEREVIADTTKAFSGLLVTQERLRLAQEVVALATGLKDTAEALARAGEVPEVDSLRAELDRRRAVNRLTLEQAALATATRALALLIGAAADASLRATGAPLLEPVPGALEELLASARANRPDLRVVQAALESARAGLRLVEAERFLPALRFSASYGEAVDFDTTNRRALFGISIPLPLWNRRQGDLRAAEAEARRVEAQRERILAQIDKEVATAFQQISAADRVVEEYAQRIVPGQEQTARLIQQGYRLGEFRLTDALLAQRDFIETRTGYLDAVAAANAARAELRRAAGIRP